MAPGEAGLGAEAPPPKGGEGTRGPGAPPGSRPQRHLVVKVQRRFCSACGPRKGPLPFTLTSLPHLSGTPERLHPGSLSHFSSFHERSLLSPPAHCVAASPRGSYALGSEGSSSEHRGLHLPAV